MKRSLLGTGMVAAMLLVASSAFAAGINLAWNNCASEGGVQNRTSTCLVNTGTNTLVGSFVPRSDTVGVTGIEAVLDLITGTSPIPAWWEFTGTNVCRAGAITANGVVNAANAICIDWANGAGAGGLAAYSEEAGSIAPGVLPSHRRIKIGFAVAIAAAADVFANQEYFAFNCLINNSKTVGTGACAGCSTPVCIVLNSVNVVPGTNPSMFLQTPTTAGSNIVTWQGAGPDCQAVPTKNSTWGQVKALYR